MASEARDLARQHGPKAIARLAQLIDDEDKRTAIAAAVAICDRAYGRPSQSVSIDDEIGLGAGLLGILAALKPKAE